MLYILRHHRPWVTVLVWRQHELLVTYTEADDLNEPLYLGGTVLLSYKIKYLQLQATTIIMMIRKRVNEIHIAAQGTNPLEFGKEKAASLRPKKQLWITLWLLLVLVVVGVFVGRIVHARGTTTTNNKVNQKDLPLKPTQSSAIVEVKKREPSSLDLSSFEKCTVTSTPHPDKSSTTSLKPFFFPQYPDSISDNVIKSIVQKMTGLEFGGKSYYAQNKRFRRCFGLLGPTIACMLVHPMVPLNPPPDDPKCTSKFASQVIYSLRNPTMALALHQNWKDIKYRNQQGQTPEANWREYRDKYYESAYDSWEKQLMEWKTMTHYTIHMYLAVEELMEPFSGPKLLQRLAALFRSKGFATVTDEDVACLWYQSIGKERLQQFHNFQYDFEDYIPGYTQQQIEFIANRLTKLIERVLDDDQLVAILKGYQSTILSESKIDRRDNS